MDNYREKVINDSDIKNFIKDHNLTIQDIDNNYLNFLSFYFDNNKCKKCQGLNECSVKNKNGYRPELVYNDIDVKVGYTECDYLLKKFGIVSRNLYDNGYNFSEIENTELFINPTRNEALAEIKRVNDEIDADNLTKGIAFWGSHGSGKTYLMAKLAIMLAKKGKKVFFCYYPDLVREFKNQITDNTLEASVLELKQVDCLMLDDFGAENMTSFVRDEILGPILQFRMDNHLLTCITSNLDKEGIHEHLKETKDSLDELKALRIEARLQTLMNFVNIQGKNYRN